MFFLRGNNELTQRRSKTLVVIAVVLACIGILFSPRLDLGLLKLESYEVILFTCCITGFMVGIGLPTALYFLLIIAAIWYRQPYEMTITQLWHNVVTTAPPIAIALWVVVFSSGLAYGYSIRISQRSANNSQRDKP